MIDRGQKFAGGDPAASVHLSSPTSRTTALDGALLPLRQNRGSGRGGHRLRKPLAAKFERGRAASTGQEAEMADFDETRGQDVK